MFDGKLYIQTGKSKDVYKQLIANPNAEICAFAEGKWIRVSGILVPDERREVKKHMLDEYPNLRAMYSEDDDNTIVLCFTEGKAVIASFADPAVVIEF